MTTPVCQGRREGMVWAAVLKHVLDTTPSRVPDGPWLCCPATAHVPPPCPRSPACPPATSPPVHGWELPWGGMELWTDPGCASHGDCGAVTRQQARDVIRCPLGRLQERPWLRSRTHLQTKLRRQFFPPRHERRLPRPRSCPDVLCSATMSLHNCLLEEAERILRQGEREMRRQMRHLELHLQQLREELPLSCPHQPDPGSWETRALTARLDAERELSR